MLTPQEITDKKFDKVIMGGYDMAAVDAFLDTIEKDYGQIYKENIVLKNKMKVLVSKIEEYRTVDESMRKALLSAQSMAVSIVEKAKAESAAIEKTAQAKAEEKLNSYKELIAAEEMRLEEAKTGVQAFVERMLAMYAQEMEFLQQVKNEEFHLDADAPAENLQPEFMAPPQSVRPAEVPQDVNTPPAKAAEFRHVQQEVVSVKKTGSVLPDTVPLPNIPPVPTNALPKESQSTKIFESELTPNTEYPNSVRRAAGDDEDDEVILLTPKPRFEFNDLQFGDNYDKGNKKKNKKR